MANRINLHKKKIIATHEHTAWNCKFYEKYFLNVKYLFMIRDPRASIAGSFKTFDRYKNFAKSFKIEIVLAFWLSAERFVKIKMNKVHIIVNEKINYNIKKEIKKFCNWSGITFSKSLLKPTFKGKRWFGDSAYIQKFELKKPLPKNYYSASNTKNRWISYLDKKTILLIEVIFKKLMSNYNYKPIYEYNFKNILKAYISLFFCYNNNLPLNKKYFFSFKTILKRILILLAINNDFFRRLIKIK
jgi:hypothetical protein